MEQRSIERVYAHFHRILSELLSELVKDATVTWLQDSGHLFSGDYTSNTYSPAIYAVSSLGPYYPALAELTGLQAEVLDLTGRNRPGRNLLPPLARDGDTHVRISRYADQSGIIISRESDVNQLR